MENENPGLVHCGGYLAKIFKLIIKKRLLEGNTSLMRQQTVIKRIVRITFQPTSQIFLIEQF